MYFDNGSLRFFDVAIFWMFLRNAGCRLGGSQRNISFKKGRVSILSGQLFWAWLKKKLRQMDLADAVAKRPVLGKTAFRERVRRVLKSKAAQQVAKNKSGILRKVCRAVVRKKGAASGF